MISIVIPTYEMHGQGVEMLRRCISSIHSQTYTDYEIIVSDNSENDLIKKMCEDIVLYVRNPIKGICANTNNAMRLATGDLIKILNQDDYLAHPYALQDIDDNFEGQWLIAGCDNNINPYYTGDIHQGNNKLGGPSVLTIRNKDVLFFDESLTWLFDCDYYKKMYATYGAPKILNGVNVCIGIGDHQVTSVLGIDIKEAELLLMTNRYAHNTAI